MSTVTNCLRATPCPDMQPHPLLSAFFIILDCCFNLKKNTKALRSVACCSEPYYIWLLVHTTTKPFDGLTFLLNPNG